MSNAVDKNKISSTLDIASRKGEVQMGNRYKGLEIRKQRGLTQDELCERAGLSRQTLYELEKGIKTDVKNEYFDRFGECARMFCL